MPGDRFNEYCEALLAQYTRRNTQTVTQRLESLCGFLRQKGNVVQTMLGGSVRQGTYVTGLSDIDALLIVNQSSLVNQTPAEAIEYVRETIQHRLRQNTVSAGNLAVTVSYSDGTEIQILPAIRTNTDGVRIAEPGSTKWSNVARPDDFAKKLARVNTARDGRVVPAIRLAKAMADCLITRPSRKISGYHMESLAIDAFKDYQGPLDPKNMLIHLLGHAMDAVKSPIADSTGQSRYVDDKLGRADGAGAVQVVVRRLRPGAGQDGRPLASRRVAPRPPRRPLRPLPRPAGGLGARGDPGGVEGWRSK